MRVKKIRPFGLFVAVVCGLGMLGAVYSNQPAGRITLTTFCFGFACRNAIELDDDDIDFGGPKRRRTAAEHSSDYPAGTDR